MAKEGSYITINVLFERWIPGEWISIAVGSSRLFNRILISASCYLIPVIYVKSGGLVLPYVVYLGYSLVSVVLGLILWVIEKRHRPLREVYEEEAKARALAEKEEQGLGKELLELSDSEQKSPNSGSQSSEAEGREVKDAQIEFKLRHFGIVPLVTRLMLICTIGFVIIYTQLNSFAIDFIKGGTPRATSRARISPSGSHS